MDLDRLFARISKCGALALVIASIAAPAIAQSVQVQSSVAYTGGERGTLDVYLPRERLRAPIIVFIYGGSWQSGDKSTYSFVGEALARRGFITIVPDYRVYPKVRFPEFLLDNAKAVRWASENADRLGGDSGRIFIMGHSAGAYNAAMLSFDPRWLKSVKLTPKHLSGFIGVSGPYDFLPLRDRTLSAIFGGENRRETQPIDHASKGAPPSLLITGTFDTVVDPDNSSRLAARLRSLGNHVALRRYPAVGHIAILGGFGTPLQPFVPVLNDVDQFVRRTPSAR